MINIKLKHLAFCLYITSVLSIEQSKLKMVSRIVRGESSMSSQFPYFVSLSEHEISYYTCGGAIISEWHVLTAAHCVYAVRNSPEVLIIRFGFTRVHDDTKVRQVEKISVHQDVNIDLFHNDIALLKIVEKVKFSPSVQPIPMAQSNFAADGGLMATLCGFGVIKSVSPLKF